MRREDIDPFLRSLAGPKYRPAVIAAAITVPALTLLATMCLCCGISSWIAPPASDRASLDNLETIKEELRQEEILAVRRAFESGGDDGYLVVGLSQFGDAGKMPYSMRVLQILGDEDALINQNGSGEIIWLSGQSTSRWVDGTELPPGGTYLVAGRRQYTAVTGAGKTVIMWRWISPEVVRQIRAELRRESAT